MKSVAALVFVTTIAMPALQLFAVAYGAAAAAGRVRPLYGLGVPHVRSQAVGMVEVFMLGVLVSLVKLAHLAGVVAGVALWSFAALMLVMAGISAVFDARGLWARASVLR
jgi:paraquat-inducible protein A